MRKYFIKKNDNWTGPYTLLSLWAKVLLREIQKDTELWHKGVCKHVPPVEHPSDCKHDKINAKQDSYLSWLYPKEKIKSIDKPLIAYSIYGLALISAAFISVSLISITIFSYTHKEIKNIHNNYQVQYAKEFEKVVSDLKRKGDIDEKSNIKISSKPKGDLNLFGGDSDIITEYDYQFDIKNIKLGEYDVSKSEEAGLVFGLFVNHLYSLEALYDIKGKIVVTITGEADSKAFAGEKMYEGEYGNFYNEQTMTSIGVKHISLIEGDAFMDNVSLAFLRAKSIWSMIKQKTDLFTKSQTELITKSVVNTEEGGNFRNVKVTIEMNDVKKKETKKALE